MSTYTSKLKSRIPQAGLDICLFRLVYMLRRVLFDRTINSPEESYRDCVCVCARARARLFVCVCFFFPFQYREMLENIENRTNNLLKI